MAGNLLKKAKQFSALYNIWLFKFNTQKTFLGLISVFVNIIHIYLKVCPKFFVDIIVLKIWQNFNLKHSSTESQLEVYLQCHLQAIKFTSKKIL